MDPVNIVAFNSRADPFTSLTAVDEPWVEFAAAASTEERPSELSPWQIDEYWGALVAGGDLWAQFMSQAPKADRLSEPSTWETGHECPAYAEREDLFDCKTIVASPAIDVGSSLAAATVEDESFLFLSGSNLVAERSQSPKSTATDSPPEFSLELSQQLPFYSESLPRECPDPRLTLDCESHNSEPESDGSWLAAMESSEDQSPEIKASPRCSRMTSRRANYGRGGKKSHRCRTPTKSHAKIRKSNAQGDREFFPRGARRHQCAAGRPSAPEMLSGSTCLRISSVVIGFPDESRSYSFNRRQKQWVHNAALFTESVDTQNMSQSTDAWAREFMEVSIYVDDQRLHFGWDNSAQTWTASSLSGNEVPLEHDIVLKLIKEPPNRVWLNLPI